MVTVGLPFPFLLDGLSQHGERQEGHDYEYTCDGDKDGNEFLVDQDEIMYIVVFISLRLRIK